MPRGYAEHADHPLAEHIGGSSSSSTGRCRGHAGWTTPSPSASPTSPSAWLHCWPSWLDTLSCADDDTRLPPRRPPAEGCTGLAPIHTCALETPTSTFVIGDADRARDRLVDVTDRATAPTAHLVAEQPRATRSTTADAAAGHHAPGRPHQPPPASSRPPRRPGQADAQGGVVEVLGRASLQQCGHRVPRHPSHEPSLAS